MPKQSVQQLLEEKKSDIYALAKNYGIKDVRVFGSVARGEDTESSDIDFLVTMERGHGLFDRCGFWSDVEEVLGREIDVLTEKGLHWSFRQQVIDEAKPL